MLSQLLRFPALSCQLRVFLRDRWPDRRRRSPLSTGSSPTSVSRSSCAQIGWLVFLRTASLLATDGANAATVAHDGATYVLVTGVDCGKAIVPAKLATTRCTPSWPRGIRHGTPPATAGTSCRAFAISPRLSGPLSMLTLLRSWRLLRLPHCCRQPVRGVVGVFAAGISSTRSNSRTRTFQKSSPTWNSNKGTLLPALVGPELGHVEVRNLCGEVSEFLHLSGERLCTVSSSATTFTIHGMLRNHLRLPMSCQALLPVAEGAWCRCRTVFLPRNSKTLCFAHTGADGHHGGQPVPSHPRKIGRAHV